MNATSLNQVWGRLLIEELIRCGVNHFVVAPGSRSAPLALAVAENPRCTKTVHFDERGAAFYALGYAKATGRPAAVLCTSGTAAANLFPAVVEANYSGVPLIVLTADRPPELRDTGASQTIDQINLFGSQVRRFFDVPTPTAEVGPQVLLSTVDTAVAHSLGPDPGPVHLNCPFREPLAPIGLEKDFSEYLKPVENWLSRATPFTLYAKPHSAIADSDIAVLAEQINSAKRGVIVAGYGLAGRAAEAIADLAEKLQWPLLAESTSGLRASDRSGPTTMAHYDLYLRSEAIVRRLRPDLILQFGRSPISKATMQYLSDSGAQWIVVAETPRRIDPVHRTGLRIGADPAAIAAALKGNVQEKTSGLLAHFQSLDALAVELLEPLSNSKSAELHELTIAFLALKSASCVFLAASMPVRLAEMAAAAGGVVALISANRGVNGIDGTVATAAGFACGASAATTLLLGDLALLHDLNSLALLRSNPQPVVVICFNNDGGGIFSHLPIAKVGEMFEPYFGTPHGLTFRAAAELFNIKYHEPKTPKDFATVYRAALKSKKPALIEIRTSRETEVEWLRKLWIRVEEKALRRLDELVNS